MKAPLLPPDPATGELRLLKQQLRWLTFFVFLSTVCVSAITANLWSSSSLLGSTVNKANGLLDEARATGILPLVKELQERIRTEGNATATVVIEAAQQTSTLLLAYTRAIGTVNATEQVQRVQQEVENFLLFIDAIVRQRSLSITLP